MLGADKYMAPESFGRGSYSTSIDLYALGLVMYDVMNYGTGPFFPKKRHCSLSSKEKAINVRLSGKKLPPPINASPEFSEIILKACAFDRKDRYFNASHMRIALEEFEQSRKPVFTPGSIKDEPVIWLTRQEPLPEEMDHHPVTPGESLPHEDTP
jgi:serine/threonine-protein kinase